MPISLQEFKSKRGKAETIDYGDGDSVVFRWQPDRVTDDVYSAIRTEAAKPEAEISPFAIGHAIIVPLVTEWDITDKGKPLPITAESVDKLGLYLCMDIVLRIQTGISEASTKKDSGGG